MMTFPKLILSVFGGLVIVAAAGITAPLLTTDGTESYTGAQQDAAKYVVNSYLEAAEPPAPPPAPYRVRVSRVAYTPGDDAACRGEDNYYAYTVTLKTVWWFGITTGTVTTNICQAFGGDV